MKIYTYYQEINFAEQNELINLWKMSWSRKGYQPVVLNLDHAKKHPYFETLDKEMRRLYYEITGKKIQDYGMSCWFRWLAYSTQDEKKFYVSDYDAINVNFSIIEPNDKLHMMDGPVPFLASGSPSQFENLCKAFVEITNERIDILKMQANHYHDQEFFIYNMLKQNNPEFESYQKRCELLVTRDRSLIGGGYDPITRQCIAGPYIGNLDISPCQVFHISHYNCGQMLKKYPKLKDKYSEEQLRILLIKELLSIFK